MRVCVEPVLVMAEHASDAAGLLVGRYQVRIDDGGRLGEGEQHAADLHVVRPLLALRRRRTYLQPVLRTSAAADSHCVRILRRKIYLPVRREQGFNRTTGTERREASA